MNPEQLKNDAKSFHHQVMNYLGLSVILMILPYCVLYFWKEQIREMLVDLILARGILFVLLIFLLPMLPGVLIQLVVHQQLKRKWRAKPESTCPHCQTFLLRVNDFTQVTGHCFECGEKLMEVESQEKIDPDVPVIPEDRKLEFVEVRKSGFRFGVCLICSFVAALSVLFYILYLMNIYTEGDKDPLALLFIFGGGISLFTILVLSVHYFEKRYPFHCPSCDKSLSDRTLTLILTQRCPHCQVEIVKQPEAVDESKTVRFISPKELIRVSHVCQKYLGIIIGVWLFAVLFVLIPTLAVLSHRETGIPDWVLGLSSVILLFSIPFPVLLAEKYYSKHYCKKYGTDCWCCGKSLLRKSVRSIIQSGNCPSCGQKVLEED